MGRMSNEFWWNLVVDRVVGNWNDVMSDADVQELLAKENLVLIRSARECVTRSLLEKLSNSSYAGNLHVIGRQEDEKYISEYSELNIDLFTVDDSEVYSVENTKVYIDGIQADAVCFLGKSKVSSNHDNLLQIVQYINCQGYAVLMNLRTIKFDMVKMHNYFRGKVIYDELCDWFYDTK